MGKVMKSIFDTFECKPGNIEFINIFTDCLFIDIDWHNFTTVSLATTLILN